MISLLIIIAIFSGILVVGMIASTPGELQQIAHMNCFHRDGRRSPRRTSRELASLCNLVGSYLLVGICFALPIVFTVTMIDSHVVPIPFVHEIMGEFDWDQQVMRENVKSKAGSHRQDLMAQGMSDEEARDFQRSLFENWPLFVIFGVAGIAIEWVLLMPLYVGAVRTYRTEVLGRWMRINWGVRATDSTFNLRLIEKVALQTRSRGSAGSSGPIPRSLNVRQC